MSVQQDDADEQSGTRFPFIALPKAIERARQLWVSAREYPVLVSDAVKLWGYTDKASGGRQTTAALKYYGLVEDIGSKDSRKIKLTDDARRYFLDERPEQHASFHSKWIYAPRAFATLRDLWRTGPPTDDRVARSALKLDLGYSENSAAALLDIYKTNLAFATRPTRASESAAEASDSDRDDATPLAPLIEDKGLNAMPDDQVRRQPPALPPVRPGMLQDTFNIPEGVVVLSFPERMSQASYEDLAAWLDFEKNRLKRWISDQGSPGVVQAPSPSGIVYNAGHKARYAGRYRIRHVGHAPSGGYNPHGGILSVAAGDEFPACPECEVRYDELVG